MNKNTKQRRAIRGVMTVIVLIVVCIIGLAIRRILIQNEEDKARKQAAFTALAARDREKHFTEFEKLFREQQDDLNKLVEVLVNSLGKKNYLIVFDEESYSRDYGKELLKFLYLNDAFQSEGNEEIVEILNENIALKEVLNTVIENGAIIDICACTIEDKWMLEFPIDSKFTPFITGFTGNNGIGNIFQYCEEEGLEEGYNKQVEENWYLWISPPPDR